MNVHVAPRLLADIGGTYARFAIETAPRRFEHVASLKCADHADFHAAVSHYLKMRASPRVAHAAVAIANPVSGDAVRMTNYHWQFSIERMRRRLGLETLLVVNDFTALAMALPRLETSQRRQVGGGVVRERSVIGLIGAGSGLGVSGLIPVDGGWVALGTEGGHASFSPRDEREVAVLRYAWRAFPHVSFERLLSGSGLGVIHSALAELGGAGRTVPPPGGLDIARRALDGSDPLCVETLDVFCAMLGTAASNLAVTQGAFGGVYIGGGIVPRLGTYFDRSTFRARFEDKGRFSAYCRDIPTFVITEELATFLGVSTILARHLRDLETSSSVPFLVRIGTYRAHLSPAERRVADHVVAHPRAVMNEPINLIAHAVSVSQPTVIRFCRSIGCSGLSDLKLRLAASLPRAVSVTHTPVTGHDPMAGADSQLLKGSTEALSGLRERLSREQIDRAVALLVGAARIEFYGSGSDGLIATQAQLKFMRLRVACTAFSDPQLQHLAADAAGPGVAVAIIDSSGRSKEMARLADDARARGAKVLALTSPRSPLARRCDALLPIEARTAGTLPGDGAEPFLYLAMIDELSTAWCVRQHLRAAGDKGNSPTRPPSRTEAPGRRARRRPPAQVGKGDFR